MLKQVTLFFNTGFNSINFPADPQTLYLFDNTQYPVMDLVQENFLSAIKIKASEDEILDADYLRIGDAYYSVEGYVMTSQDIAMLSVTQNAILSVGGIDKLEYITGEVFRSTAINHLDVDSTNYALQDELLTYSERRPTRKFAAYGNDYGDDFDDGGIAYENKWYGGVNEWAMDHDTEPYDQDIYTSLYDDEVPEKPSDIEAEELLGESGAAAWATLQTAWIDKKKFDTTITIRGLDMSSRDDINYDMPGVSMYTGYKILNAAIVMNGFGISNFIIDSYTIPRDFVDIESSNGHITRLYGKCNRATLPIGDRYENLIGSKLVSDLDNKIMNIIANQVIDVTIESMTTGDTNTVRLSDIQIVGTGVETDPRSIAIDLMADPSPTGCPYYKLLVKDRYGGTVATDGNPIDTLLGSIRGATWLSNPLLFERTGFARDLASAQINQGLRRTMFDNSKEYQTSMYFNNLAGKIANTASMGAIDAYDINANTAQAFRDNYYDKLINSTETNYLEMGYRGSQRTSNANAANNKIQFGGIVNAVGNVVSAGRDWHAVMQSQELAHENMKAQYAAEMMQLGLSHPGRELVMRFPISDNTQLAIGNGIMISVKSISRRDLDRYVRTLQQYGVACYGKMDKMMVKRYDDEPYNYIQAHGVTVKYQDQNGNNRRKINKQLLSAITDMFTVGFRLWYEKPDEFAYQRMYVKEDQ